MLERLNSWMDQDLISPLEYDEEYAGINPRTLEQIYVANYKSGFWELEIYTTGSLEVPEYRRPKK